MCWQALSVLLAMIRYERTVQVDEQEREIEGLT